jgi:NADH:ubiquinone oxidoreductase subunit C
MGSSPELIKSKAIKLTSSKLAALRNNSNEKDEASVYYAAKAYLDNQQLHLGIIRTTTMKHNIQTNVDENITKARRSAYSLFGCGFHGHNGLESSCTPLSGPILVVFC